jgi:hypothetical protein
MNIFPKTPSLRRVTKGTVVGKFSYAGATGGTWILDAEAQVFFWTDSSGNFLWTPQAGARSSKASILSTSRACLAATMLKTVNLSSKSPREKAITRFEYRWVADR